MPGKYLTAPISILIAFFIFSCSQRSEHVQPPTEQSAQESSGLDYIKLPAGFRISVFANIPSARSLTLGNDGTLYIGARDNGKVYAARDTNGDGVADKVYTIASGLHSPNGVAFHGNDLYVAEISRIIRFRNIGSQLDHPPACEVVYDQLPTNGEHGWKFIAFGPDGKLYVPVGAPCNVCESQNPVYASITRMNPDGTGFEVFASGVRNTVGFDWHPETKELWFTDNGRDNMGDNLPADELNRAPAAGMHFGFPYCHQGDVADPEFGQAGSCSGFTPPELKLTPHGAALGMRFYTGQMFPAAYRGRIFIAEHGSWNRSSPIGYRLMMVRFAGNKAVEYLPFASGWLDDGNNVKGRPVDVQVASDGALLVSDDRQGLVYRISSGR
jgi:glucose/arabinose dehydrogenase